MHRRVTARSRSATLEPAPLRFGHVYRLRRAIPVPQPLPARRRYRRLDTLDIDQPPRPAPRRAVAVFVCDDARLRSDVVGVIDRAHALGGAYAGDRLIPTLPAVGDAVRSDQLGGADHGAARQVVPFQAEPLGVRRRPTALLLAWMAMRLPISAAGGAHERVSYRFHPCAISVENGW